MSRLFVPAPRIASLALILFLCATLTSVSSSAERPAVTNKTEHARGLKDRYLALTDSWAKEVVFTPEEEKSMREGKAREELMIKGPDDPLGKQIRAAGEPSFDALAAVYPGKILDRTILGTYSDPDSPLGGYNDEFAIYWNGAIAANLVKARRTDGRGETGVLQMAHNTVIEFRVGADDEIFGKVRSRYSSVGYENGYLPIVTATYEREGVAFSETAFAHKPKDESEGWDIAYVRMAATNTTSTEQTAQLTEHIMLMDGGKVRFEQGRFLDPHGAILAAVDDSRAAFDTNTGALRHSFKLAPGGNAQVHLKIPFVPDAKQLLKPASAVDFASAYKTQKTFWEGLLSRGARIEVPEPRVNNVYRALLAQNFVLADGPRFTYGSGIRYNDSTYPQENGFGAHVFAMYGFKDYADKLQRYFLGMCVTPKGAGRKYQNRRAMALHHLLEDYRLTGSTNLFRHFASDYYRVADEIVSDRHSTMTNSSSGEKPLYWGWLPPDKPGADVEASTQRVYVPGHNINNCQGLQDFGRFLIITGIDPARGEKYVREAEDFRKTLMSAMERAAIRIPGQPPFVDLQTLMFRETPDYGPEPYDDLALGRLQGTYSHYWVDMEFHYNFFNPGDEVGHWLADYVRERNGFVLGLCRARRQWGNSYWVNNVYDGGYYNYRLRNGDVQEFIYGLYARLAFGMSRYTCVASEGSPFIGYNTVHGGYVSPDYSFPNSGANSDTLHMIRNALVYEELTNNIETGTLFLLKGAPRKWLEPGKRIRVERLVTYFGDLSFTAESDQNEHTVHAKIDAPAGRWEKIDIALAQSGSAAPRNVEVNGKPHTDFDSRGNVRLRPGAASYQIEVHY